MNGSSKYSSNAHLNRKNRGSDNQVKYCILCNQCSTFVVKFITGPHLSRAGSSHLLPPNYDSTVRFVAWKRPTALSLVPLRLSTSHEYQLVHHGDKSNCNDTAFIVPLWQLHCTPALKIAQYWRGYAVLRSSSLYCMDIPELYHILKSMRYERR